MSSRIPPSSKPSCRSSLDRSPATAGYLVLVQVATALVLILAANTAFADFPRLSSFLARDGFMPRQFGFRGDRLAFTVGIGALAGLASILLVAFGASVNALIPLYTLGVFVAFTLSQSGMVVRWWQRREAGWQTGILINGLGAAMTAVIAVVVVTTKFLSGRLDRGHPHPDPDGSHVRHPEPLPERGVAAGGGARRPRRDPAARQA